LRERGFKGRKITDASGSAGLLDQRDQRSMQFDDLAQ
jgi:hypothetical protein